MRYRTFLLPLSLLLPTVTLAREAITPATQGGAVIIRVFKVL